MRKYLNLFFIIVLIVYISCSNEQDIKNQLTIKSIHIYSNGVNIEKEDIPFKITFGDSLKYLFSNKEIIYINKSKKIKIIEINENKIDTLTTFIDTSNSYIINKKEYTIIKIHLYRDIDGGLIYYFSPEIGIIIIKSDTWYNFGEVINNPLIKTEELETLKSCIYNDRAFISLIKNEPPPPPSN